MTRDEALARIRKCLALSGSDNPHEAATALRQAQALMREHGITRADITLADVTADRRPSAGGRAPPRYLAALFNLCGAVLGAHPIYTPVRRVGRWHAGVTFVGVGGRVEIAGYAYEVLERQLRAARARFRQQHRRLKRASRIRRADAYCAGWVEGVRLHVTALAIPPEERALIRQYCRAVLPEARTVESHQRPMHASDSDAIRAGIIDGRRARLHHGVQGPEAPRGIEHQA